MKLPTNPDDWTREHEIAIGDVLLKAHHVFEHNDWKMGEALDAALKHAEIEVSEGTYAQMLITMAKVTMEGFPSEVDA